MYSFVVGKLMRRIYRDITAADFRLIKALAADDVTFVFPGASSFGGTYEGKPALLEWLQRFAELQPKIEILDVVASGPPWNTRVGARFDDTIGDDYRNQVMEMLWVRWGKVHRLEVFLDTERISSWEGKHPELATASSAVG